MKDHSDFVRKLLRAFPVLVVAGAMSVTAASASAAVAPQVAPNYTVACMLSDASGVRCAGDNDNLALGDGTVGKRYSYADVPGMAGKPVSQLATGERHVCALISGGVQCWGDNQYFQLAQGGVGTTDSADPLAVKDSTGFPITDVTQVATQDYTTCARRSNGSAWCWGQGSNGQLGDGGVTDLSLATQVYRDAVTPLSSVVKVVGGSNASCALLADATVVCWGSDASGALGNGADGNNPYAAPVVGLTGAIDIGLGDDFACALISDGTVKCWGADGSGNQGNGPGTTDNQTATAVPGLAGVSQLAVGYATTCVLRTDASVFCWGYNEDKEVDASGVNVDAPINVPAATGAIQLGQQWDETPCALFRGGGIKCWGYNGSGQVGLPNPPAEYDPTDIPGLDLVTLAYPGTGSALVVPAKPKVNKRKTNYSLTAALATTPGPLVVPAEACTGAATASVRYSYTKIKIVKKNGKKRHKKVKVKKAVTRTGALALSGANCAASFTLSLPVKYLNGKKVTVNATAAGNGSLQPVTVSTSYKLAKVKIKKKKH